MIKLYVILSAVWKRNTLDITDTHWYVGNSALWFQSRTVQSSQLQTGLKHRTLPASFNNTRSTSSSSSVSTTMSPHPQSTSPPEGIVQPQLCHYLCSSVCCYFFIWFIYTHTFKLCTYNLYLFRVVFFPPFWSLQLMLTIKLVTAWKQKCEDP